MISATIVILNDYCYVNGGGSKIAIDEAVGLAEAGLDVVFLGAVGPICHELQEAPLRLFCLDQGELRDAGKKPWIALQSVWNTVARKCMDEILDTVSPQNTVVHLHGYTKALSTSPIRAALKRDFPVVFTLHDFFSACPNGAFFNYPKRSVCHKRALSLSCIASRCDKRSYVHKVFRVGRSLVQTRFGRLPTGVIDHIALSETSSAILQPYLSKNARLHAIENPVDTERRAPIEVQSNTSIMAVGRLDIEKGVELLAKVAGQRKAATVFVGDGPLRPFLETQIGVTVTGWLSHTDVISMLNIARCLVFPSLWYETYGLVVSEAAARGVPAIVSDISAAAERVIDGITGWHFKSGDPDDLARCLAVIGDDHAVAAAGRAAYHQYWSNPPTREKHIRQLTEIYQTILDNRKQVRSAPSAVASLAEASIPEF